MRSKALGTLALLVTTSLAATGGAALAQGGGVKPAMHGLIYMGDIGFHRQDGGAANNSLTPIMSTAPGVFSAVVINATWAQLQPSPGGLDTSAIDHALSEVRAYNSQHPRTPLAVKLRIWPGPNAPEWAKSLGGPPVSVLHTTGQQALPITVGRFWAGPYRSAWRQLQDQLAAHYDNDPLILETSNSSCSSITNEPVLLPVDETSVANLHAAGFTDNAYRSCLMDSASDYSAWRTTRVDFFINPYRAIDQGRPRPDIQTDEAIMQAWRQQLGPRGILSNAGLKGDPPQPLAVLYQDMRSMGPPLEFQMFSPNQADYDGAVRLAASLGANAVELWGKAGKYDGFQGVPPEQLQEWSTALRSH